MSTCKTIGVVLTVAAATALSASAAILVSDDGQGWSVASAIPPNPVATTINAQGQSSVHGSAIPVVTPNSGVQLTGGTTAGLFDDLIFESAQLGSVPSGGLITGVSFDFYMTAGSPVPSKLSIYFDTTDAYTWYYDITPVSGTWLSSTVSTSAGGWYSPDGGTSFAASLAPGTLNAAGIRVLYANNASAELYGLANYQLHGVGAGAIPEPGTYMMLSTALMSLGFTFARRRAARKTA